MAIVPAVECAIPGIVVQHRHVEVLVVKGNVCILVCGGFSGVSVVHLSTGEVGVCDVERPTDHKRLAGIPLRVFCVPSVEDLERVRVQLADDYVPGVLVGGVHGPQAQLVRHQVDVREASPRVGVNVMEPRGLQGPLGDHAARLKAVPHDDVALHLVVVQRAVVHHMVGSGPFERQVVGSQLNSCHKIIYGFKLFHYLVVGVAVHVPDLRTNKYRQRSCEIVTTCKTKRYLYTVCDDGAFSTEKRG